MPPVGYISMMYCAVHTHCAALWDGVATYDVLLKRKIHIHTQRTLQTLSWALLLHEYMQQLDCFWGDTHPKVTRFDQTGTYLHMQCITEVELTCRSIPYTELLFLWGVVGVGTHYWWTCLLLWDKRLSARPQFLQLLQDVVISRWQLPPSDQNSWDPLYTSQSGVVFIPNMSLFLGHFRGSVWRANQPVPGTAIPVGVCGSRLSDVVFFSVKGSEPEAGVGSQGHEVDCLCLGFPFLSAAPDTTPQASNWKPLRPLPLGPT